MWVLKGCPASFTKHVSSKQLWDSPWHDTHKAFQWRFFVVRFSKVVFPPQTLGGRIYMDIYIYAILHQKVSNKLEFLPDGLHVRARPQRMIRMWGSWTQSLQPRRMKPQTPTKQRMKTCNLRYCQVCVLIRWNVLIQGGFQVDSVDTVFQYVSCVVDVVPFFGETHGEPFEAAKFALLSVLWTPSVGH